MPKHTFAINVLNDELERILRNILYIEKCIRKIQKNEMYRNRPAIERDHTLRLKKSLKEQIKNSESIKEAIKALEEDN
jgi:hypothetical protein